MDVVKITRGSTTGPANFPQAVAQSNFLLHESIAFAGQLNLEERMMIVWIA